MTHAITTGVWIDVSAPLPRLNGLGTEHVSWGRPASRSGKQSGYRFTGRRVPVALDGSEFILGTFTHNNFVIWNFRHRRFKIHLRVNVAFDQGGLQRDFSFTFRHNETPNRGRGVPDEVLLSSVRASETVELDGGTYAVEIVGFKQNDQVVGKFISAENRANSAVIVARLVRLDEPEPEPQPEPEPEPGELVSYCFDVRNADGSIFGKGCFSYPGLEAPIDLTHVINGAGRGPALTSFWYRDPVVGTVDMSQLLLLRLVRGQEDQPSRFSINVANVPDDSRALVAGPATPADPGTVSTHRNDSESHGCGGRTLTFPTPCECGVEQPEPESEIPAVDLVVVIDSSVSMRPDAVALSESVSQAIEAARSSCPSNLKVTYLGIEGRFRDTLFDTTIRQHLTGLGVDEADMRGRKRGTVASGGAQEDGARAIEDVTMHHDWRPAAKRAIFFLGDEGLEGGDTPDGPDIEAATRAIDVANTGDVRVHTYLASSKAKAEVRAANKREYARVAANTGGQAFTADEPLDGGFQAVLEQVICASKKPAGEPETEPCPCSRKLVESALAE